MDVRFCTCTMKREHELKLYFTSCFRTFKNEKNQYQIRLHMESAIFSSQPSEFCGGLFEVSCLKKNLTDFEELVHVVFIASHGPEIDVTGASMRFEANGLFKQLKK